MDDIDDYFDDDLVLDERALAILDREEKKFLSQKQREPPPPPPLQTVTKRQKTRDGWSPGVGSRPRDHEFDDLPEISVSVDGNYGFTDSTLTSGSSNLGQAPLPSPRQASQYTTVPPRAQSGRFLPRAQPGPQPAVSAVQPRPSPAPNTRPRNPSSHVPNGSNSQLELQNQITQLQAQLQELKNENQKIQEALREATDIRYVKEGEVSILPQSHAAEIAKMKAAREELEAKQKQMERQMKEETERLKTQFMFKAKASLRRPPSTRAVKISKNAPATPVRVPNQIHAWRNNQEAEVGQRLSQTPLRNSLKPSPRVPRVARKSPEIAKRSLLGFQNAFAATPHKATAKLDLKGKGRDLSREASIELPHQLSQRLLPLASTPVHQRSVDSFDFEENVIDNAPGSDDFMPNVDEDGDSIMFDDGLEGVVEEVEPIEPINRKLELSRIILTHIHKDAKETTFQLLINLPYLVNLSNPQARDCTQAVQSILLALSNPLDDTDYTSCARQVIKRLVIILRCLLVVNPCFAAAALFNLLFTLTLSLPSLTKFLELEKDNDLMFLAVLFDLLDHHKAFLSSDDATLCLREMLLLLEILLSNISDETISRFNLIPNRITTLLSLLNASRSDDILEVLGRVLLLLTTYSSNQARILVSIQDGNLEGAGSKEPTFLHHITAYILDNFSGNSIQRLETYGNMIGCFAQLSLSQVEQLIQSTTVIPTLTYMVATMTMKLWNDDGHNIDSTGSRSIIRFINQTLFLLHHLVHSSEPIIRLHDKLQHCLHQNLANLVHMFVVGFGQLSYADPPDWIDAEGKAQLEFLAEFARDLLDLAVDGPESDSVWAAYQMEPDNDSETDDEEREARLMETDMQS
ncbi:hypothetical protein NP233_g4514 [Leucocoprinus birnbaumii]|uniref:Uncharacterized protein n=1 Tax=Leucocoprinus birnbaumii TaxID=56174 RepID=A0AAD5YRT3_9AGAR|nr:hypothetical protein NP233_g4514 [Leucocoprinus birnbaumii]